MNLLGLSLRRMGHSCRYDRRVLPGQGRARPNRTGSYFMCNDNDPGYHDYYDQNSYHFPCYINPFVEQSLLLSLVVWRFTCAAASFSQCKYMFGNWSLLVLCALSWYPGWELTVSYPHPLLIAHYWMPKGLLPLLKSIHKPCNLKKFEGKTLGVDTYGWLHRGTVACAMELATGKPTKK